MPFDFRRGGVAEVKVEVIVTEGPVVHLESGGLKIIYQLSNREVLPQTDE